MSYNFPNRLIRFVIQKSTILCASQCCMGHLAGFNSAYFWWKFVRGEIEIFAKGWWLLQEKGKTVDKLDIKKKSSLQFFFFIKREYFGQKLPEESEKISSDALQQQFMAHCCEKNEWKRNCYFLSPFSILKSLSILNKKK